MTRMHRWGWLAVVAMIVTTAPALAQESPLAVVPAGSPVVIQVRGVERTKDRLVGMIIRAMKPQEGIIVGPMIDKAIKDGLDGREFKGLAKEGPAFAVLTALPKPGDDVEKNVVLLARVTDYAAFRDGILKDDEKKTLKKDRDIETVTVEGDRTYHFAKIKDFVIVAPSKELAQKVSRGGAGLQLAKPIADALLGPDVAVYVDMAAINKEYGEQIQDARRQIPAILDAVGATGGGINKDQMEAIKAVIDGLFQAIEDSQAALLSVDFRPEGLALNLRAQMKANSKTDTILKGSKTSALKELGTLPAGQMFYTAGHPNPALEEAIGALFGKFATDPEGPLAKVLKEVQQQLSKAGRGLEVQAGKVMGGIEIHHFANAGQAADAHLKLFKALKKGENYQNMPLKKIDVKEKAASYRDFQLHSAQMEWDLDAIMQGLQGIPGGGKEVLEAMKKLMGESANLWFGTNGKVYIQVTAKDLDEAKKLIDDYLGGKGTIEEHKAYRAARTQLPAEASSMALVDVPQLAQMLGEFMHSLLQATGFPVAAPPPAKPREPVYIGFAVTMQPQHFSLDLWIPTQTVQEVRDVFEPMFKALIPGRN